MDEVTKFCKNLTLLCVSNESSDDNTFKYFKELFGSVVFVDNYDLALRKFDEFEIDIVITDIEIEAEDGFSLIRELKNKNSKIISMIYTNNDEKSNFLKAISSGVNGYFLKPLDENDFLSTLANLLQIEKEKKDKKILKMQYDTIVEENTIVSKTDKHGIITYVNDNFCKSSEYSREELLGKSHNIVRHPENPKELFKDLWQTIKVKNKNLIMKSTELREKIKDAENSLKGEGKIVVRSSGTESLVRVMVEAKTMDIVEKIQEEICNFILTMK